MDYDENEMLKHKQFFIIIINNGCIKNQNVFFERPDIVMKNHSKPLLLRAKVENMGVNKVLIDGRPQRLFFSISLTSLWYVGWVASSHNEDY